MLKFITNYLCVVLFFVVLEGVLYFRDYNELMVMDCYVKYELENNNFSFSLPEKYEFYVKDANGNIEYSLIINRDSLFNFERYKKIKYNGIVY